MESVTYCALQMAPHTSRSVTHWVSKPAVPRAAARKSALRHVVDTFFDGSAEQVVAAVLGGEATRLSDDDLTRIADLVAKARKDGKR